MTLPGPPSHWPQEQFVDPLTGEPIPGPFSTGPGVGGPAGEPDDGRRAAHHAEDLYRQGFVPPIGAARSRRRPGLRSPGARLAAGLAVVTVLVLAVIVGASQSNSAPGPLALPTAPRQLPPTTESRVPVTPVVPGWQGVAAVKHGVAYDVPPDWRVETPATLVGYDDPQGKPLVVMSGVATYKEGFCGGHRYSYRAHIGFSRTDLTDPTQAARNAVRDWADAGYADEPNGGSAQVIVDAPTTVQINGGATTATQVVGRVTVPAPKECDAPSVLLSAVAVPLPGGGLTVCVTEADQNVPGALPTAELQKIISTIRPLHR